jgi:transcriptional regulator with XRE-family HTH domain
MARKTIAPSKKRSEPQHIGSRRKVDSTATKACYGDPQMLRKSLPGRLKALRTEQHLSVAKVAQLLDVTESHVFGIEGGYGQPSLAVLEELARLYRVDECDLFTFPGEGVRHDIREELRKVPSVQANKLVAILDVVKMMVAAEEEQAVSMRDQIRESLNPRRRRRSK